VSSTLATASTQRTTLSWAMRTCGPPFTSGDAMECIKMHSDKKCPVLRATSLSGWSQYPDQSTPSPCGREWRLSGLHRRTGGGFGLVNALSLSAIEVVMHNWCVPLPSSLATCSGSLLIPIKLRLYLLLSGFDSHLTDNISSTTTSNHDVCNVFNVLA
jgi:hypothetical protein